MKTLTMHEEAWTPICQLADILPYTGVCALFRGQQVAVFRVGPGANVYAIGNFDPFSKANVLSRGIVGDKHGRLKVASPIYKQNFCLETGECLDDPAVSVPVFDVRVSEDQRIELRERSVAPQASINLAAGAV
jgi:nitrite reductase (NADH) small subunit